MPELIHSLDVNDDVYNGTKNLRLNQTNKRLRRLRAFERVYYKKTCEVKKTGHGLEEEHRLQDGNLRYAPRNLTYSLNKKKRWLLPKIIEERICEHDPHPQVSNVRKGDQTSTIDERLKIVMYENVNTRHRSTCIRYGNSQIEPHIIHKNGRRFNSDTLTKWMDFNTRERWGRRHRRNRDGDQVNQPNFGIEQRPGFFPSEVTYEFLFPRSLPAGESHRDGKTSLAYSSTLDRYDWVGRHHKDTTKHRRKVRRYECMKFDPFDQEYDPEEEEDDNMVDSEYFISSSSFVDENKRWSIVIDDYDDHCLSSIDFPIDYFFPSPPSTCKSPIQSDENLSEIVVDRKANKHFEPPPPSATSDEETKNKPAPINERILCTVPCENESKFLSSMQQSNMKISQANLSPSIFLQRTTTSSFSVIYTYQQTTSLVQATLKYADSATNISVKQNPITLDELVELISKKLDEDSLAIKEKSGKTGRTDVNALRGSLPLPLSISRDMLLVTPTSKDRQTALKNENLFDHTPDQLEQWFDTTNKQYEMFECAICCEVLTADDVHELLPCHHTLCHSCLASYIRTSVASATYSSSSISPITCFLPNCPTQLNPALLQAFVSYEIYHSYCQTLVERRLFSSGRYRQCPSRACSDLLVVNDDPKPSLMCSCGQRVCSTCLEEYHFPATCKQYKTYEARLRQSSDHLLSVSKVGDDSNCYIAEGKNCPSCGEFVEKNGGCPHMTCKCGNEYCWMCLKRWSTHNYSNCFNVPESTHELRSSSRSRFFNKAIHHRRQRNQHQFDLLEAAIMRSSYSKHNTLLLSTYIDLNTLAEFIYVLMQRRRINGNIRAVLGQTANRLEVDAFHIRLQSECGQFKIEHLHQIRARLQRTVLNLLHMKNTKVLL